MNENKTNQTHGHNPSSETQERLVLPLMKSVEDAHELCRLEQDDFYMSAFFMQIWYGEATNEISDEYAVRKGTGKRRAQSGQSWRSLDKVFGRVLRKNGSPVGDERTTRR